MYAQDKTQCHQTAERRENNTMNDFPLAVCSLLFLLLDFEFEFIYCSHSHPYILYTTEGLYTFSIYNNMMAKY